MRFPKPARQSRGDRGRRHVPAVRARHAAHACSSAIPWSPSREPSPRRERLRERSSGSRSIIGSVSDGSQAVLCSPLERQIFPRFGALAIAAVKVLRNAKVSYKNLRWFTTTLKDWASPAILLRERLHPSSASTLSLWGLDPAIRGCPGGCQRVRSQCDGFKHFFAG